MTRTVLIVLAAWCAPDLAKARAALLIAVRWLLAVCVPVLVVIAGWAVVG